jgi:iron complex transport system permease protein
VLLTLALARGVQQTLRLLLAGVVVGVVLGAASSLVLLVQPQLMQAMQGFMLGSTALVGWGACVLMLGGWCLCMALAWGLSPVLDGLSLGESTAASLGLPVVPMRIALVLVLALATGTAVAHTGLIAHGGAYDRATFVEDRESMLQVWADYLEKLTGPVTLLGPHTTLPVKRISSKSTLPK